MNTKLLIIGLLAMAILLAGCIQDGSAAGKAGVDKKLTPAPEKKQTPSPEKKLDESGKKLEPTPEEKKAEQVPVEKKL